MKKKRAARKPRTLLLFFDTKEACWAACDAMGLSRRKCSGLDRTHDGDYSRKTKHYAFVFRDAAIRRVNIRFKLMLDDEERDGLPEDLVVWGLGHIDSNDDWIV